MIIDTIGVSYNSMEELIERQHIIENQIEEYIQRKGIADRYESTVTLSKDNRYYLSIKLIED